MPDTIFDVAIVGGGPAGAVSAAVAAQRGLQVLVLEREQFPREKVCGDCLNPACRPLLERLGLGQEMAKFSQHPFEWVEFIGLDGRSLRVELPAGPLGEIGIKRSILDTLLLNRARDLGAEVREQTTIARLEKTKDGQWAISTANAETVRARFLIAADGRNSTVARQLALAARPQKERIALQTHLPLPKDFGRGIVLQLLPGGYSGQAPVGENELNVCLVSRAQGIEPLKRWAEEHFGVSAHHPWRSVTPLTRDPIAPMQRSLFLVGDAARVVEPFTGEGIYYAMATGELAADSVARLIRGESETRVKGEFEKKYRALYRGRLWINRLARRAVISPRIGSFALQLGRLQPSLLRLLTSKIVRSGNVISP